MVGNGLVPCWPVRSALTQKGRWLDPIERSNSPNLSSHSPSSLEERECVPGKSFSL